MAAVIPAAALRPAAASHCVGGAVLFPVHLHKELEQRFLQRRAASRE